MSQPANGANDIAPAPASTPRVWLVTGYRAGESHQILALAEALGWPYEHKRLSYRRGGVGLGLLRRVDLRGIDIAASSPLQPPWPDLVISAGMRNEPVVRWIRAQSGGRTRLVHIGRSWAPPRHFDLLITTPQYRVPPHPNILHNTTTLTRITASRLEREADRWRQHYARLPGPYLAVVLGGHSGPYTLGRRSARRAARRINALAAEMGASVLLTSSARTPAGALQTLERHLEVPFDLYRWRAGDAQNPYFGILALSEALVVSADSVSMLSEACATGKPVYMLDLDSWGFAMRPETTGLGDWRFAALAYSAIMRLGPARLSRDLRLVHQALLAQGRAVWLGERFERPPPPGDETAAVVQKLQRLMRR